MGCELLLSHQLSILDNSLLMEINISRIEQSRILKAHSGGEGETKRREARGGERRRRLGRQMARRGDGPGGEVVEAGSGERLEEAEELEERGGGRGRDPRAREGGRRRQREEAAGGGVGEGKGGIAKRIREIEAVPKQYQFFLLVLVIGA
ncbi:hypothetical protein GWI33_010196 [Rhynchophorus ferrugineus]|uniref:Uncharacterized protein n=1 Tax=Rhynchophorus ferrugineus TaxID=354439 RepID=A0A834MJS2_RHYFE|nr:hypothetical protein GWI33_010196 [Rhynchophorus ferrugineus]